LYKIWIDLSSDEIMMFLLSRHLHCKTVKRLASAFRFQYRPEYYQWLVGNFFANMARDPASMAGVTRDVWLMWQKLYRCVWPVPAHASKVNETGERFNAPRFLFHWWSSDSLRHDSSPSWLESICRQIP
jgi:hypothetical protein